MELILDFILLRIIKKNIVQQYIKNGCLVSRIVMRFTCRTKKTQ